MENQAMTYLAILTLTGEKLEIFCWLLTGFRGLFDFLCCIYT